jgi:hypothetical protein
MEGCDMTTRRRDEHSDLERVRAAAHECARAAAQIADFADRMSAVIEPAQLAEFDTLVARETLALSQRVDAFGRLGFGVGSLDATGEHTT